jgi:lipid II:glycine glycyltransferase (peptidoglycan interpeptide bridge formation enzyme)
LKVTVYNQPGTDPDWDDFLAAQPTGQHLQSSLWGQLKAEFGWRAIRILAREGDQIIGGAQILTRKLPIWGSIGYISRGPVIVPARADVMGPLFDHIERVARDLHILILSIQPPEDSPVYMQPLQTRHFQPSSFYVVPATTVLVDLCQSEDEILAQMKKSTRYGVRSASRSGVTVREGDESDLPLFFKWAQADAARDPTYATYSLAYYQEAWRQFAPRDMMKLFVACYQDEPLATTIVISLGKWGVYKWGASSGAHPKKMSSYLAQWAAIRWCKEKGCHYYDLGGITPSVANRLKQGDKIKPTDSKGAGIAYFKMGFGQLFTFPGSYDSNYGFRPRWLIRTAVRYAWRLNIFRKLARGAWGG